MARGWKGWYRLVLTGEVVLCVMSRMKVNGADPGSRSSTEIRVSFLRPFIREDSAGEDRI